MLPRVGRPQGPLAGTREKLDVDAEPRDGTVAKSDENRDGTDAVSDDEDLMPYAEAPRPAPIEPPKNPTAPADSDDLESRWACAPAPQPGRAELGLSRRKGGQADEEPADEVEAPLGVAHAKGCVKFTRGPVPAARLPKEGRRAPRSANCQPHTSSGTAEQHDRHSAPAGTPRRQLWRLTDQEVPHAGCSVLGVSTHLHGGQC